MKCEKCNIDLIPGYAINPGDDLLCSRPRLQFIIPLKAEEIELIFTAKCSQCGHNEKLTREQQLILTKNIPPGYHNWNQYWESENKQLPRNWLKTILEI